MSPVGFTQLTFRSSGAVVSLQALAEGLLGAGDFILRKDYQITLHLRPAGDNTFLEQDFITAASAIEARLLKTLEVNPFSGQGLTSSCLIHLESLQTVKGGSKALYLQNTAIKICRVLLSCSCLLLVSVSS